MQESDKIKGLYNLLRNYDFVGYGHRTVIGKGKADDNFHSPSGL